MKVRFTPGDSIDDSIFSSAIMEMIRANDEREAANSGIPLVATRGIFSMSAFTSAEIYRQSAD